MFRRSRRIGFGAVSQHGLRIGKPPGRRNDHIAALVRIRRGQRERHQRGGHLAGLNRNGRPLPGSCGRKHGHMVESRSGGRGYCRIDRIGCFGAQPLGRIASRGERINRAAAFQHGRRVDRRRIGCRDDKVGAALSILRRHGKGQGGLVGGSGGDFDRRGGNDGIVVLTGEADQKRNEGQKNEGGGGNACFISTKIYGPQPDANRLALKNKCDTAGTRTRGTVLKRRSSVPSCVRYKYSNLSGTSIFPVPFFTYPKR